MPAKKTEKSYGNRIKQIAKDIGASSRLISLWVNVDYTTVSNWNSNKYQPSTENLNQIGELLEVDNRDLLEPQERVQTEFAKAMEQELQRLHKEENIPYEVEQTDKKTGKTVMVNNPDLMQRLKEFGKRYKKKWEKLSPE